MDTHFDREHHGMSRRDQKREDFIRRLTDKADKARQAAASVITGGKVDESIIAEWNTGGVSVRHLPPDDMGILRISIGGGDDTPVPLNYCVFRGDYRKCIELLRKALAALEKGPE